MKRGLAVLDGATVGAGLLTPEQAQKGAMMEFETKDSQARPWLSIAADTGMEQIFSAGGEAVANVAEGKPVAAELEALGETVVELEILVIADRRVGGPALKSSTVDRKGHTAKGVDTGEMIASLDKEVTL